MNEIDLVPTDYRHLVRLRRWARRFVAAYLALLLSLGMTQAALAYGIRARDREVEKFLIAESAARNQKARLEALVRERASVQQRLKVLDGLRGGVAAREMFVVVDGALDGDVWFLDWKFRRAGELVDRDRQSVDTGYFIVVPFDEQQKEEKAWRVQTHMEIRAQAVDHSALAAFVRRLVEDPRIQTARVLETSVHRYTTTEVVDFDLAVVVRTRA